MADIGLSGDAMMGYAIRYFNIDPAAPGAGQKARVSRWVDGVEQAVVRGGDMALITSTDMTFYDYEAPFNTGPSNLSYFVDRYDSTETSILEADNLFATSTDVPNGFALITNVLDTPVRSAAVVIDLSSWSRATNILGKHTIIGRRNPVVATDVMGGRTGTFSVANIHIFTSRWDVSGPYTYGDIFDGHLETMFDDGGTLLFRSNQDASGFSDMYFVAESVNTTRMTPSVGVTPLQMKQYDISYVEVDRPVPTLSSTPLVTWADVLAQSALWSDVASSHSTWEDVLEAP